VVVDMTAGTDAFAAGLFTRFDLTVLVSEPTRRGVGVYRQYAGHAAGHGMALRVLGNKVTGPDDVGYLRDRVGDALVGWLGHSAWVRAAERGEVAPLAELEPANRAVLDRARGPRRPRARLGGLPPRHRRVPPAQRRRLGRPGGRRRPRRAGRPGLRAGRPVLA
jgi:CO dehydrogenase maturation factor